MIRNARCVFKKLQWNVIIHDFNGNKFITYNVLREDLLDDLKKLKYPDYKKVRETIRSWAMYHYWSKSEFEIVVSDLFSREEEKIDAYRQIEINLDRLTEYLIKELKIWTV